MNRRTGREGGAERPKLQPHDTAMRLWAETNLVEVTRWLDPSLSALDPTAVRQRDAGLAVARIEADLLIQAGADRLLHVEYETTPGPDLAVRLLNYRARIMAKNRDARLSQHVIVLGDGRLSGHDQPELGFTLNPRVTYLREQPSSRYLHDPVLAPFAVLCRGSANDRERYLEAALTLIRDSGHPNAPALAQTALGLAGIRLDPQTVERIQKESEMKAADLEPLVDMWRDTQIGRRLHAEGLQEGHQAGHETGLREGQARLLLTLLRRRFGDRPDASVVAERLASWSATDALRAIDVATDLPSLLTARPTD